jgi:hypothetical protein
MVNIMSETVRCAVEALLSPRSLASDSFLAEVMGVDLSVPIAVLQGHSQLKDLLGAYADPEEALIKAVSISSKLSYISKDKRIRPLVHVPRTTVVVRGSEAGELHALLENSNTWVSQQGRGLFYVKCKSEEEALEIFRHLQQNKVKASIKNETLVKSIYSEPPHYSKQVRKYSMEDFVNQSTRGIESLVKDEKLRNMLVNEIHVLRSF